MLCFASTPQTLLDICCIESAGGCLVTGDNRIAGSSFSLQPSFKKFLQKLNENVDRPVATGRLTCVPAVTGPAKDVRRTRRW